MFTQFNTLLIHDALVQLSKLELSDEKKSIVFNNINDCIIAEALEIAYKEYTLEYAERIIINDVLKYPLHHDCIEGVIVDFSRRSKDFLNIATSLSREYEHFNEQLTRLYENIIDVLEFSYGESYE